MFSMLRDTPVVIVQPLYFCINGKLRMLQWVNSRKEHENKDVRLYSYCLCTSYRVNAIAQ